jgi:hypothetical protein
MNNNIFQVIHEDHINKIIKDNPYRHIVIGISNKILNKSINLKEVLLELSQNNKNAYCIYVDLLKYTATQHTYTTELTQNTQENEEDSGKVLFYFDNAELGNISNIVDNQSEEIISTFNDLNIQIKQIFNSASTKENEIKKERYTEIEKIRQHQEITHLEKIKQLKELEENL